MLNMSFVTNSSSVSYLVALAPDEAMEYFYKLYRRLLEAGHRVDELFLVPVTLDARGLQYVMDYADWTPYEEYAARAKRLFQQAIANDKHVYEVTVPAGPVAEEALGNEGDLQVDSDVIFISGP